MSIDFSVKALSYTDFSKYFEMSQSELSEYGAYTFIADECPCYPCRVSLQDAQVGENVLAISFQHLSANSPYNASGPIFVRENAKPVYLEKNTIPQMLRHRLLSVRGYNKDLLLIEANTIDGENLESVIMSDFDNEEVSFIQLHNAGPGCFNCSVERVV